MRQLNINYVDYTLTENGLVRIDDGIEWANEIHPNLERWIISLVKEDKLHDSILAQRLDNVFVDDVEHLAWNIRDGINGWMVINNECYDLDEFYSVYDNYEGTTVWYHENCVEYGYDINGQTFPYEYLDSNYIYSELMECFLNCYHYEQDIDGNYATETWFYDNDYVFSNIQDCWIYRDNAEYVEDEETYVTWEYAQDNLYETPDGYYSTKPSVIYGYHDFDGGYYPVLARYEEWTEDKSFFGIELEVDNCKYDDNEIATHALSILNSDDDLWHCERDISVNHEYISQPLSYEKWLEEKDNVKSALSYLSGVCESHNAGTCGLHIHLNNNTFNNQEQYDRFKLILEYFKNELFKYSRRQYIDGGYYNFLTTGSNNKDDIIDKLDSLKRKIYGHNSWINEDSNGTFELRMFRGTLNIDTFYATLETVNEMVKIAKDETISIVNFSDFIKSDYNKEYCERRDIKLEQIEALDIDYIKSINEQGPALLNEWLQKMDGAFFVNRYNGRLYKIKENYIFNVFDKYADIITLKNFQTIVKDYMYITSLEMLEVML